MRSSRRQAPLRPGGATVIRPATARSGSPLTSSSRAGASCGVTPVRPGMPVSSTSTNTRSGVDAPLRWRASALARGMLSREWMTSNIVAAARALLRWRWPIMCQVTSPSPNAVRFPCASWTRLSPTSRSPSDAAVTTASTPWPLVTASSRTPAGSRPAASAARRTRPRTFSSRSATSAAPARSPAVRCRREQRAHFPMSSGSSRPSSAPRRRRRGASGGRVPGGLASTSSMVARICSTSRNERYTDAKRT